MASPLAQFRSAGILGLLANLAVLFGANLPVLAQQDIAISLDSMGISGSFRPGGWTPVRVALTSSLDDTASVLVSFEIPNSDGDIERYTRPAVLAPGQTATRWLYPHLPPSASAQSVQSNIYMVRVYENDEGTPGGELASAQVSGSSALNVGKPVEMTQQILLVVGSGRLGLQGYEQSPQNAAFIPSLNSRSSIINVQPEDLPDRWEGLSSVSTMIWSDASPQALGLEEANAIRAWIRRGGRLIIVLPESGNPWGVGTSGQGNFLTTTALEGSLLPEAPPRRINEVPISRLMQVLSKSPDNRNPDARMTVRGFDIEELSEPWEPLATLPSTDTGENPSEMDLGLDGMTYAVQRRLGHGWMVLVGIDADSIHRRQLQADGLPQPDVFWNRLLGRRGTIPTTNAYRAYADQERLATRPTAFDGGSGKLILDLIRIGGPSAGFAMLITLALFITYWALAGPGSFAWLRSKGLVRLSWMSFVCIAVVFTLIALVFAWAGRRILQEEAPVRHITFLDMIDGEPTVRATSWLSAYLPGYGRTGITVAGDQNLLATWSPPPSGTLERFPNSGVIQIVTDTPNTFEIPARATSAHFVTHWTGELDQVEAWLDPPNDGEQPIEFTTYASEPRAFAVEGIVRHGLPWVLSDVQIICISPFQSRLPIYPANQALSIEEPLDAIPNPGIFAKIGRWAPGTALDLGAQLPGKHVNYGTRIRGDYSLSDQLNRIYNDGLRNDIQKSLTPSGLWESYRTTSLEMYAYFDMLPQPIYLKDLSGGLQKEGLPIHFRRWLGSETDCSDWFLRPCVLILARIDDVPLPVPLEIDGEQVESTGTVMLRWIHPLPVENRFIPTLPRALRPFQAPPPPQGK